MKEKIVKKIPNALTIIRLLSSFIAPVLFIKGSIMPCISLYSLGVITDCLDGYIARKFDAVSELGRKLDAISDKVFALSVITLSIIMGNSIMFLPLILESLIAFVNVAFKSKGIMTKTNRVGKFKTVILFPTSIFGLAMTKLYSLINVFVPLLILSTRLQLQTLASYINEYKCEYEKKHDNSYQEEKHIDSVRSESYDREITKEKLINLKNELLFYTCNDIDIKLPKRKIKSL